MALSVNTSDSLYSQVIQSAQNRRRVSEQSGQPNDAPRQEQQVQPEQAQSASAASGAEYERAYEQARDSLRMPNATSPQAAAYANVQQLSQRDELQGLLAFSAYA